MFAHIRACLWLLVLTVLLCSVVYPLSLWVVGQTVFPHQANGSLVIDENGKPVGSWLIAQEFKGDEYFQARPSAVSYNGAASAATNYAANNYLLRDKVARALGPIVKYRTGPKNGQLVAGDIVTWFRDKKTDAVAAWAKAHTGLAQARVKEEEVTGTYVEAWFAKRPALMEQWQKDNPDKKKPKAEDLAVAFFESFAKENPGIWLTVNETKDAKGEPVKDAKGNAVKQVDLVKKSDEDSADIAAVFFDMWRQEHPDAELEDVPADLVTASASGLDPHITLKSALYQLNRVAAKWDKAGLSETQVRAAIENLLRQKASAPLFGLAGVEMVNVLEVNLALTQDLKLQKRKTN